MGFLYLLRGSATGHVIVQSRCPLWSHLHRSQGFSDQEVSRRFPGCISTSRVIIRPFDDKASAQFPGIVAFDATGPTNLVK